MKISTLIGLSLLFATFIFPLGCQKIEEVTVYCALDQAFSEPILRDFEKETGIKVKAVFDIEANKTVGLVRTLIEEKKNPRCDVFWNNELAQTVKLKQAGVLQAYKPARSEEIPESFRDAQGYWHGFAARARIFIVNTNLVSPENMPKSLQDFQNPKWKGQATMAKPLTGTTVTHVAALFSIWGAEKAKNFCNGILNNEIRLAQGNAHVSKLVAKGEIAWGWTDTDDYYVRKAEGSPVVEVYPDANGEGTLLIPNSLALVAGARNAENGKKLIDWLLRSEIEQRLAFGPSGQIPLRPGVEKPAHVKSYSELRVLEVDWERVAEELDKQSNYLRETFAK